MLCERSSMRLGSIKEDRGDGVDSDGVGQTPFRGTADVSQLRGEGSDGTA